MREIIITVKPFRNYLKSIFLLLLFIIVSCQILFSQSVSVNNNLNVGTFTARSTGGSFVLTTNDQRNSVTGTIILLSSTTSALYLTVVAPSGGGAKKMLNSITFNGGNSITLTRAGGGSMTFTFGTPLINGVSTTLPTQLNRGSTNTVVYGGTLTVGGTASNPDGTYSNNNITVTVNF